MAPLESNCNPVMRFPATREPEDWAVLALMLTTAVFLLLSESFWRLLPF
jgi:hypothetical protein